MKKSILTALLIFGLLAIAEIIIRMLGFIDFPLYNADNRIGYVPAPSQSGVFLNQNDWATNNLGMGVSQDFIDGSNDILLIGDSIVWGGNPYKQAEKLGPSVQSALDRAGYESSIWPISAGSWSIINEINWLDENPKILQAAETMVFVLNNGDFGKPSSWANPLTHPREKPLSALVYLAKKYFVKPIYGPPSAELQVPAADSGPAISAAITTCKCRAVIWLYPERGELDQAEIETTLEKSFALIAADLPPGVEVHRVRQIPGWNESFYADGIHPTPDGMKQLGGAIAEVLHATPARMHNSPSPDPRPH